MSDPDQPAALITTRLIRPGREDEFRRGIDLALDYARVLGNRKLHVMAGMVPPGADRARHRDTYLANLRHATQAAAAHGITILIEPINQRDIPGYFLSRQDDAQAICAEVEPPLADHTAGHLAACHFAGTAIDAAA